MNRTDQLDRLNLGTAYRSGPAPLWVQLLAPLLSGAILYRRAAGYFDSSVFDGDPDTWQGFVSRGGAVKLVCSPCLWPADILALYRGLYEPQPFRSIPTDSLRAWSMAARAQERPGTRMLSWLVANGRLEVFIAVPTFEGPAIYHEKFALITLRDQEFAFCGSANETSAGYFRNFERLEVARSAGTVDEQKKMVQFNEEFRRLIENKTPGLTVYSLHEAFVAQRLEARMPSGGHEDPLSHDGTPIPAPPPEILRMPPDLSLRPHQRDAIDRWFDAGGRGIFGMATGAGKTIAALATAAQLLERKGPPIVIIVVAPYIVLVDQWITEMRAFGLSPLRCAESRASWEPFLRAAIYRTNATLRPVLSIAVTNATFASPHFQDCIASIEQRTILIGDEVHNLGARRLRKALPERITLRLGLSATPVKWMDTDGTAAIRSYFGAPVAKFSLADALKSDPPVLCPYYYYPVLVELSEEDQREYLRVLRRLASLITDPLNENLSEGALSLLLDRSRLMSRSANKLAALREKIQPYRDRTHTLIYCGDGSAEVEVALDQDESAGSLAEISQVDQVVRMLNGELGITARRYTYLEKPAEREGILEAFRNGHIQALVAIRCLDEGVDIPRIERAFILESSANPRQFIQRRGRVLRPSPGKRLAEIYDFIAIPPTEQVTPGSREFRTLGAIVGREMERVADFCSTAQNAHRARASLDPVTTRLGLGHF